MTFHEGKCKDCCPYTYAPSMVEDRCRVMEEIGQRKRQRSPSSDEKKREVPLYAAKFKVRRRILSDQSNPFSVHTAGGLVDASTNTEPQTQPDISSTIPVRGPLHLVTSTAVRELMKIEDPTLDGEAESSDMRGDAEGRPSDIRDRSKDCEEPEGEVSEDQQESLSDGEAEGEEPES